MDTPGDVLCEPKEKIIFNAPFIDTDKLLFHMTNDGTEQIGWAIKINCPERIRADPSCGVLDPKTKEVICVTCDPFDDQISDVSADRITIEWVLTPANAGKHFKQEWFQGDVITRRKIVPIHYNF